MADASLIYRSLELSSDEAYIEQCRRLRSTYDAYIARRRGELQHFRDIDAARAVVRLEKARNLQRDLNDPDFADAYAAHQREEEREALELRARHEDHLRRAREDGRERFRTHMRQLGAILTPDEAAARVGISESIVFDAIGVTVLLILTYLIGRQALCGRPVRRTASNVH